LERIVSTARSNQTRSILLAEDNPADVYLIREAIAKYGGFNNLELFVVTDGEQAIDFVLRRGPFANVTRPDLIVLDLNLPKSDGVEVLRRIREHGATTHIPVVVFTSSDSPADRSATQLLGADHFITKPSDLDAFMAVGAMLMSYIERPRTIRASV
jgi:two-component system, chemotaxis family, response regulator Rcp1